MNILLMTDIEGITNVDTYEMIQTTSCADYVRACTELMLDTNAAISGFYDAGIEKVYVYDGHSKGTNFIKNLLDPRAEQVYSHNWHSLITSGKIDAYAEVGLHAMAGTENAFLEHTQSSKTWFDYKINGESCGELIQGAAYVGAYNIPMIFVSGDRAACNEAKRFIPNIATAEVKEARGRNRAVSIPSHKARALIRKKAEDSVRLIKQIQPYKVSLPAEITVTFQRTDYCDEAAKKYARVDSRTVKKVIENITDFYSLII